MNAAGEQINATGAAAESQKITGVYFSAHWCPPCRAFTPTLVEVYNMAQQRGLDFEIVFVSFDHSEEDMLAYMTEAEMPWVALPYDSDAGEKAKEFKRDVLESTGIPFLVILNDQGEIITKDGRGDVQTLGLEAFETWRVHEPDPAKRKEKSAPEEEEEEAVPEKLPAPEKDSMTLQELLTSRFGLEGKVVETEVTLATSLEQQRNGQYRIFCHYHKGGSCSAESVYIPEEGKELFEELTKKQYSSSPTDVYLRVSKGGRLTAVGSRYRKSTGEYSW
jgi:thiol-disulfide isomerase/thioredoxin